MITKKIKLKNRRVEVGRRKSDDSVFIQFSRLKEPDDDIKKVSETEYIGKKVETRLLISQSAAVSLYYLLRAELNISDLHSFEKETGQKLLAD